MGAQNYILLKATPFKEADLQIYALNSKGGKQHFLARSALKSKRRFGGGMLEPMNYVHLTYDDRKEKMDFVPLTEARLLDGFEGVRKDYDRLQMGLLFLKDVYRVTVAGEEESGSIFNLLGNTLKKLESTSDLQLLQLHFRIKLLFYSGYLPNEDGAFNSFLNEPVQNCEMFKKSSTEKLKILSDQALKELGVF